MCRANFSRKQLLTNDATNDFTVAFKVDKSEMLSKNPLVGKTIEQAGCWSLGAVGSRPRCGFMSSRLSCYLPCRLVFVVSQDSTSSAWTVLMASAWRPWTLTLC